MKLLWSFAVISRHSFGDELVSSVIRGIGMVLSMTRLAMLVAFTAPHGNALTVAACAGFGSLLVSLYSASTLDHSISIAAAKPALRALEHIAIHVLIAGTCTPFTLISSPGAWARPIRSVCRANCGGDYRIATLRGAGLCWPAAFCIFSPFCCAGYLARQPDRSSDESAEQHGHAEQADHHERQHQFDQCAQQQADPGADTDMCRPQHAGARR